MLIYDDIRFKLNNMKPRLSDLRQALDLDKGQEEIAALEAENKLLKEQVSAQADQAEFYEDCIAEMATVVYA